VLDPHEIEFPFDRAARFRDLETDDEVVAVPSAIREQYRERIAALIDTYRTTLGREGIDYCLLQTSEPLEVGLLSYLQTRRRAY
jgi:hypothetical protein